MPPITKNKFRLIQAILQVEWMLQPHGYAKRKRAGGVIEGDISPELCRFGIKKRVRLKLVEYGISDVRVCRRINIGQIHRPANQGESAGGSAGGIGCGARGRFVFTRTR